MTLRLNAVWVTSLALLASACSLRYEVPEIRPADAAFPGIRDGLNQFPEVDVLMVHGMCHHAFADWVEPSNRNLAAALGLAVQGNPVNSDGTPIGNHGARLFRATLEGAGRRVHTYAIVWSPVSEIVKKQALCYDVVGGNKVCPKADERLTGRRAMLNRYFKDGLLNECLADAVFYSGEQGRKAILEAFHDGLFKALSMGRSEACRPPQGSEANEVAKRPLFIVTESLGSKMLMDALDTASGTCPKGALDGWLARPVQVFMGANQLPLLSLAYTPPAIPGIAAAPALSPEMRGLRRLLERTMPLGRPSIGARPVPRVIVALSDPNDLLSYTLRPFPGKHPEIEFVDVLVSNSGEFLGLFENPLEAHTGYLANERVQRIVACGSRGVSADCPVGAER